MLPPRLSAHAGYQVRAQRVDPRAQVHVTRVGTSYLCLRREVHYKQKEKPGTKYEVRAQQRVDRDPRAARQVRV